MNTLRFRPLSAAEKPVARSASTRWKFVAKTNPIDNKKKFTLTLISDKPVLGHPVVLKLECEENPPSGEKWYQAVWFIYEPDFKDEIFKAANMQWQTSNIRLRFDDGQPESAPNIHERDYSRIVLMGAEDFVKK